jgi:hypothetical protein
MTSDKPIFKPATVSIRDKSGEIIQTFVCEYRSTRNQPLVFLPPANDPPKRSLIQRLFGIHPPAPPRPLRSYLAYPGRVTWDAEVRTIDASEADLYFRDVMRRIIDVHASLMPLTKADYAHDLIVTTEDGTEILHANFPKDIDPDGFGHTYIQLGFDWIEPAY